MKSKHWIKFWIEVLDDPKMGRLPNNLWRRFFELCLLAGELDKDGRLPPLDDIAWRVRIDTDTLQQELEALGRAGLLDYRSDNVMDGYWFVIRFADRQARMNAAERMKRMRDTHKRREYYDKRYADVTVRITETEEEEEEDKDMAAKNAAAPPEITNEKRAELERYFCQVSKLPVPKTRTKAQKTEAGTLWYAPLREMLEMTGGDVSRAKDLIEGTIEEADYTVASPKSILKSYRALYAKRKRTKTKTYAEVH